MPLLGSEEAGLGSVRTAAGGDAGSSPTPPAGTGVTILGKFSAVSGDAGTPTTVYMDDAGSVGGGSGVPLQYPTSARTINVLRLVAPVGTAANPPTATLMKNGVATAMTCTLPAGAAAGAEVSDSAHSVSFVDGDRFDVRLTQPTAAEGPGPFTATLEGPAAGSNFPGFGPAPPAVAAASSAGSSGLASQSDHTHAQSFGGAPPAVAVASSAGAAVTASRSDHTHAQTFGTGVAGPTALGAAGVATTARRSDQIGAAYRSDLPLSTTWFIDPVNGSDAATNPGTTSATALRSRDELFRRWWGAVITSSTTVTVLGSLTAQTVVPFFECAPGATVTFLGTLGATTGFSGAAIDNTIFSGTVTGFVGAANVPAADDIEMTDTAIPVSFTASGGLAAGVIYRRNSGGATIHWYALADLGAKTLQMTSPINNAAGTTWGTLNVGDGYAAYAMWQWPACDFGVAAHYVNVDTLNEQSTQSENIPARATRRRRVWLAATTNIRTIGSFGGSINCLWEVTGTNVSWCTEQGGSTSASIVGGGGRGPGNTVVSIFGKLVLLGSPVFRGLAISPNDQSQVFIESEIAFHAVTVPVLQPTNSARISMVTTQAGQGISGKGNTSDLVSCTVGGEFMYGSAAALPPFVAASTSDGAPIAVEGAADLTVAQMPPIANTLFKANGPAGTFGPLQVIGKFSGQLLTDAVLPSASYMGDPGVDIAATNLSPQRYPTSARLVTRLRVNALNGAPVVNVTVTLYKNAVATAMQVTIPAGTAPGTKFVDSSHPILFADGDDLDLRIDCAGGVAGTRQVTATLEGPS